MPKPDLKVVEPLEQLDLCDVPGVMPPEAEQSGTEGPPGPAAPAPGVVSDDGGEAATLRDDAHGDPESATPGLAAGDEDEREGLHEPTGTEPAPEAASAPGEPEVPWAKDADPLEIDILQLDAKYHLAYMIWCVQHLAMTRDVAERFESRLLEHRRLMAAMLDSAGGRIVVNQTHMKRADAAAVRIETGFEGGDCVLKLDPKAMNRSKLWTPRG